MSDDFTLTVNGRKWEGWTSVRATRGVELCPSDFEVAVTEKFPTEPQDIDIKPGDPVVLSIGSDPVLTGYIDRYEASISASEHTVGISGRAKTQDLVDCSALWSTSQISSTSVADLATKLSAQYGIGVKLLSKQNLPKITQFNVTLSESAWEIIERCARYSNVLTYDDTDGSLIIADVGATKAGGGLEQGVNAQSASISYAMDQRFNHIIALTASADGFADTAASSGNTTISFANTKDEAFDHPVRKVRQKVVISEQMGNGIDIAKARADWEVARRYGRSQVLRVVTDSWRDSSGALWTPNTLVNLNFPVLKLVSVSWVVSEVTYSRDAENGTTCTLLLMPADAFKPEPEIIYAYDAKVFKASAPGGST
jgi:prophage tail gpP-like protein